MVGRMDRERHCYYQGSDISVNELIAKENKVRWKESVKERLSVLDTKWFLELGVSTLTISTGTHLEYHRHTDDVEYINWTGLESIHVDIREWLINRFQ